MSRPGKNAFIPPSNYLDWDGIASLFESKSRGWAPNNTYYRPSSPPSTCDLNWGCFLLQIPFSYENYDKILIIMEKGKIRVFVVT